MFPSLFVPVNSYKQLKVSWYQARWRGERGHPSAVCMLVLQRPLVRRAVANSNTAPRTYQPRGNDPKKRHTWRCFGFCQGVISRYRGLSYQDLQSLGNTVLRSLPQLIDNCKKLSDDTDSATNLVDLHEELRNNRECDRRGRRLPPLLIIFSIIRVSLKLNTTDKKSLDRILRTFCPQAGLRIQHGIIAGLQ